MVEHLPREHGQCQLPLPLRERQALQASHHPGIMVRPPPRTRCDYGDDSDNQATSSVVLTVETLNASPAAPNAPVEVG